MIYPSNFEQKVGFDRIRERVSGLCSTVLGRKKVQSATFLADIGELEALLSQTQEMRTILLIEEAFPDINYVDASEFLKKLHIEGSYIEVAELVILKIAIDTATAIVNFFKRCEDEIYPYLKNLASGIVVYPAVAQRIDMIINKHGMVRDNASPELQQLRRAIHEKQTQVTRRMITILKLAQNEGLVDS
ncbi:MAG: endonuclease MutS2, partial [Bacteroidales bacterium]|nr:endonuclease MutS2 [Bacteroidales bacterium]